MLTLLKPNIENYACSKSSPAGLLLQELAQQTCLTMPVPEMLTGQLEGRFLKLMVQVLGAKRVLEIGMYTGYSALSMAEGLPDDGELVTCEIDRKTIEFAGSYFARSKHGKKIVIKEGPALETLKNLKGPFDLVFIDADKVNYSNYYQAVLPMVRAGGVILVDNVLYGGEVLEPISENSKAIAAFNQQVVDDQRVECVLLTIRDGVYFIRKK